MTIVIMTRILLAFLAGCSVGAFAPSSPQQATMRSSSSSTTTFQLHSSMDRRHLLATTAGLVFVAPTLAVADTGAEVRGTPVNAFNGLMFQYRGNDFEGLSASDIDEPSISYAEFCAKLKSGDVAFVEFMAPDGDTAYAVLKNKDTKIRIGEGYPIEDHRGYSSPTFAIRTVQNAKVPYKFTVPAVAKINK